MAETFRTDEDGYTMSGRETADGWHWATVRFGGVVGAGDVADRVAAEDAARSAMLADVERVAALRAGEDLAEAHERGEHPRNVDGCPECAALDAWLTSVTSEEPEELPAGWTAEELAEARGWLADCGWSDLDPEDVEELPAAEVVAGVGRHWDGGTAGFLRTVRADESDAADAVAEMLGERRPVCLACGRSLAEYGEGPCPVNLGGAHTEPATLRTVEHVTPRPGGSGYLAPVAEVLALVEGERVNLGGTVHRVERVHSGSEHVPSGVWARLVEIGRSGFGEEYDGRSVTLTGHEVPAMTEDEYRRSVSGTSRPEWADRATGATVWSHVDGWTDGDPEELAPCTVCGSLLAVGEPCGFVGTVAHREDPYRVDRGYCARVLPGGRADAAADETDPAGWHVHLAGPEDRSDTRRTYPAGGDSERCGWCYLGASHTEDAHAANVARYDGERGAAELPALGVLAVVLAVWAGWPGGPVAVVLLVLAVLVVVALVWLLRRLVAEVAEILPELAEDEPEDEEPATVPALAVSWLYGWSWHGLTIAAATVAGRDAGRAAATWHEPADMERARVLLRGLADGDPEISDEMPAADLSGQWADGETAESVAGAALAEVAYLVETATGSPCTVARVVAEILAETDGDPEDGEREPAEAPTWLRDEVADAWEDAYNVAAAEHVERVAREMVYPERKRRTTWQLANLADVHDPDAPDAYGYDEPDAWERSDWPARGFTRDGSPGAEWLRDVESAYYDWRAEVDPDEVDNVDNVPSYLVDPDGMSVTTATYDRWRVFVDVCGWQQVEELTDRQAAEHGTRYAVDGLPVGSDGDLSSGIVADVLTIAGCRLLRALHGEDYPAR